MSVKRFQIGEWEDRDYGQKAAVVARSAGGHAVRGCLRRPHTANSQPERLLVALQGLIAGSYAMNKVVDAALARGFSTLTYEYNTLLGYSSLNSNVSDITTMLETAPDNAELNVLAHSKAGATFIKAALKAKRPIHRADIIAPAMHMDMKHMTRDNIKDCVWKEMHQPTALPGDDRTRRGLKVTRNQTIRRQPFGVVKEFSQLTRGIVHEDFKALMASPDRPEEANLWLGTKDELFPYAEMSASTKGLPYTSHNTYVGCHSLLYFDQRLAGLILDSNPTAQGLGGIALPGLAEIDFTALAA